MWAMYFDLLGTLLAVYIVLRLAIGWEYRPLRPNVLRQKSTGPAAKGIDTSTLSGRVEQLRRNPHAGATKPTASFKKPLMVKQKRQELEQLAFFQKPPAPEPDEHGAGMILLFI
jgi:hypothetical protein